LQYLRKQRRPAARLLPRFANYDPFMSSASDPAVEVLTAEIRVLQVGSKPVTLSAARQLGSVDGSAIKAVRPGTDRPETR
jgi:hypothetical protein